MSRSTNSAALRRTGRRRRSAIVAATIVAAILLSADECALDHPGVQPSQTATSPWKLTAWFCTPERHEDGGIYDDDKSPGTWVHVDLSAEAVPGGPSGTTLIASTWGGGAGAGETWEVGTWSPAIELYWDHNFTEADQSIFDLADITVRRYWKSDGAPGRQLDEWIFGWYIEMRRVSDDGIVRAWARKPVEYADQAYEQWTYGGQTQAVTQRPECPGA